MTLWEKKTPSTIVWENDRLCKIIQWMCGFMQEMNII